MEGKDGINVFILVPKLLRLSLSARNKCSENGSRHFFLNYFSSLIALFCHLLLEINGIVLDECKSILVN